MSKGMNWGKVRTERLIRDHGVMPVDGDEAKTKTRKAELRRWQKHMRLRRRKGAKSKP